MTTTIKRREGDGIGLMAGAGSTPLLVAAIGVVAIGVAAKRGDLVRGGARLLAVQLAANAIGGAMRRAARTSRGTAAAPPPMAIDATAGWLGEALVGAVIDRTARALGGTSISAAGPR